MKTINVTFDDKEYNALIKIKGESSWHDFIIKESEMKSKNKSGNKNGKSKI